MKKNLKIWEWLCSLIPRKIDNRTVLHFFEFLRNFQKLLRRSYKMNLALNVASFENHLHTIDKNNGFVEDQHNYQDMKYGKATMYGCGCEIFAVYNTFRSLFGVQRISLPEMIAHFEKDGMVLSGKFGTSPRALCDYMESQGLHTILTTKENEYDLLAEKYNSFILTMYNDKNDIRSEVHTVNISKENGIFTAHNVYCNGFAVGPYPSIRELISHINSGKAKGISLIGITQDDLV